MLGVSTDTSSCVPVNLFNLSPTTDIETDEEEILFCVATDTQLYTNVVVIYCRWLGFSYRKPSKVRARPVQRAVWCAVYSSALCLVSSQSCWWICSNNSTDIWLHSSA